MGFQTIEQPEQQVLSGQDYRDRLKGVHILLSKEKLSKSKKKFLATTYHPFSRSVHINTLPPQFLPSALGSFFKTCKWRSEQGSIETYLNVISGSQWVKKREVWIFQRD